MTRGRPAFGAAVAVALLAAAATVASAPQSDRPEDVTLARRLDVVVPRTLAATGTPSMSIAVMRNGTLVLARAWGVARVESRVAATPDMRYAIGSVAKQFCAAALLLLQQDGKLSLDDRVYRHLPDVAHGDRVTIRQLLTHTAGYDDYWAQDYLPGYLLTPADVPRILREWAGRPLTFTPGAEFRYSNTNYVIAGAIVEKVSGVSLFRFLQTRIFTPLGMRSALDYTKDALPATDTTGYFRYALGPVRPAPREANAWLFAAGSLAMTAKDLAVWNQSLISRTLLSEASYRELQTEARRADGGRTGYGLGVSLAPAAGHRAVSHLGGGSGFTSASFAFPDDRIAIVVLANGEGRAAFSLPDFIARSLFAAAPAQDTPEEMPRPTPSTAAALTGTRPEAIQARRILEDLQKGVVDRSLFTENGNAFFTTQALADFAASLAPLGSPTHFWRQYEGKRGTMVVRGFLAWFPERTLHISTLETPDGKLEQFQVAPAPPQWR